MFPSIPPKADLPVSITVPPVEFEKLLVNSFPGEPANDWQLKPLSAERLDSADYQQNGKYEEQEYPQNPRQQSRDPTQVGNAEREPENHGHNFEDDSEHDLEANQENRLTSMELNKPILFFPDQE